MLKSSSLAKGAPLVEEQSGSLTLASKDVLK